MADEPVAMDEAEPPPRGLLCIECESHAAVVRCLDCEESFCRPCVEALHRRGKRSEHRREAILGAVMAAPVVDAPAPAPTPASAAGEPGSPLPAPNAGEVAMDLGKPGEEGAPAGDSQMSVDDGGAKAPPPPAAADDAEMGGAGAAGGEEEDEEGVADNTFFTECVPLRLSPEERELLKILESALEVSEYTDNVDTIRSYGKEHRMLEGLKEMYNMLTGLAVAAKPGRAGERLVVDHYADNAELFRRAFEVGRRYKVMNPEKLRTTYGKLMYLLQDAGSRRFVDHTKVQPVEALETVKGFLGRRGKAATRLLRDRRLRLATREIVNDGSKTAAQVQKELAAKRTAQAELKRKYATPSAAGAGGGGPEAMVPALPLTEDDIQRVLDSLGDADNYVTYNVRPVQRMLELLEENFSPNAPEKGYSLEIGGGSRYFKGGGSYGIGRYGGLGGSAKLSHDHATQYTFVRQSLTLWVNVMQSMYRLWYAADRDLLNSQDHYSLWNTGQGLNRVQRCPHVSSEMRRILSEVQSRCGPWVGLSVVHLGDRDVPNALMFIDKYTQIPRILAPIVRAVDSIEDLMDGHEAVHNYVEENWGSARALRMQILCDFFRYAFDGDGDDGGSCIDGRLTSTWNWCSRIEKKKFNHYFMLAGFQGFDGDFK